MKALKNDLLRKLNPDLIFATLLLLYPMRHIHWGVDFWDTGYNYANFTYMGLEHMDPSWLFSTYLATAVGHFLTLLPGADGLMGMNFYTGLFPCGMAVGAYFFCTGKLGMPRWIAFAGEMAALSLCWCPTAVLYNYLTYAFFLACVILLYLGLTKERKGYLFAAGVCLGCNVLVRFSNLPEAALILAVWAWDLILWREEKGSGRSAWQRGLRHTLWCLAGYLAALAVLFGYIQIRYGLDSYIEGIGQLFAMTEKAEDYKVSSMIMGIIGIYLSNLYWVERIAIIILAGTVGFGLLGLVRPLVGGGREGLADGRGWRILLRIARGGWCCVAGLILVWMYGKYRLFSFNYASYDSIFIASVLFLILTLVIAAIRILHPTSAREEKLISGIVALVILITPIGSNNGVYPCFNNLFLAAPYTLWEYWRFVRSVRDLDRRILISPFPAKAVLAALMALFLFQSAMFGASFLFVEATGARNTTAVIKNNEVLKGIRMNPERARWMEEISAYVGEHELQGREVILFGQLPALSYYLRMPSAFTPWSDLRSYNYRVMELSMQKLSREMDESGRERPVLILDRQYAQQYIWYQEGGRELLRERGVYENQVEWIADTNEKYQLLQAFAEKYNYDLTFENEKFLLYE